MSKIGELKLSVNLEINCGSCNAEFMEIELVDDQGGELVYVATCKKCDHYVNIIVSPLQYVQAQRTVE